jgi:hypothetical protein
MALDQLHDMLLQHKCIPWKVINKIFEEMMQNIILFDELRGFYVA